LNRRFWCPNRQSGSPRERWARDHAEGLDPLSEPINKKLARLLEPDLTELRVVPRDGEPRVPLCGPVRSGSRKRRIETTWTTGVSADAPSRDDRLASSACITAQDATRSTAGGLSFKPVIPLQHCCANTSVRRCGGEERVQSASPSVAHDSRPGTGPSVLRKVWHLPCDAYAGFHSLGDGSQ